MQVIVTIQESDGTHAADAGWHWAHNCLVASAIRRTLNREVIVGPTRWGFADCDCSNIDYPLPSLARQAVIAFDRYSAVEWRKFIGQSFTLEF